MATVKIPVTFDFSSGNLNVIQKQIQDAINLIEKNGIELGLSQETINKLKQDTQKLGEVVSNNFNNTTGKIKWTGVLQGLEKAGVSASALGAKLQTMGVNGTTAFNNITKSATTFEAKIRNTDSLVSKMGTTLANTLKWNLSSSLINQFSAQIQKAYYFTKDLDRSLNDIRIVSGASKDEMADFAVEANNAAKALKTTTVEYADAALVYFQQGMNAEDVRKMTEATVMGANIAGESTEEMSNLLTSTMNGYKLTADEVLTVTDKLAAVGAATAADFYELATGMSKVASMANAAGVPIDELNAQLATIVSVTKEAPESIGTSLKTIYGRMLAFKNNATDLMEDDDGELFGAPSVEAALEKFSAATDSEISFFEVTADGTKVMRDLSDIIEDIGDAWQDTENKAVKFGLATALAGSRQQNRLVALFDAWDEYKDTVETSLTSEGTTLEQNAIYMESYAAHVKDLQASAESLYMTLFDSQDMIGVVDVLNSIVKGLTQITDLLGGLPGVIGVISGLLAKSGFSKQFSGIASTISNASIKASYGGSKEGGQSYAATESTYKQRLSTVSDVYKGEDFERIRKMTEEFLSQKKAVEELSARAEILKESYQNAFDAITSDLATGPFAQLELDEQGVIQYTEQLEQTLLEFKEQVGPGLTDEASAELEDLIKNLQTSGYTVEELQLHLEVLADTMSSGAQPYEELTQEIRTQTNVLQANEEVLNRSLTPMENSAKKVAAFRNAISIAIPVITTFASTIGDDTKTAGEKFASVMSSVGMALLFNIELIPKAYNGIMTLVTAKTAATGATVLWASAEKAATILQTAGVSATIADAVATEGLTTANIAATISELGLAAGIKAVTLAMLASPLMPFVVAIGLIVGAVAGAIALFKKFNPSLEDLKEKADEAASAFEQTSQEIQTLTTRLEELQDTMDALTEQEKLGIVDQEELDKLKETQALLNAQLLAKEKLAEVQSKKASETQAAAVVKEFGSQDIIDESYDEMGYLTYEFGTQGDVIQQQVEARQAIIDAYKDGVSYLDAEGNQQVLDVDVSSEQSVADTRAALEAELARRQQLLNENTNGWQRFWGTTGAYGDQVDEIKSQLDSLNSSVEEYNAAGEEISTISSGILEGISDIDLSVLPQETQDIINQLKQQSYEGLAELDPDALFSSLVSEDSLNALKEGTTSVEDYIASLEDSEKVLIENMGLTDEFNQYLTEVAGTVDDTNSAYTDLISDMTLLTTSYENGETKLEDYTAGMYKSLMAIAALDDKTAEMAEDSQYMLDQLIPAFEELNNQYATGKISIDDYIESAKEQAKALLELKDAYPALADSIDELLNKSFDMDGLMGLLDTDELISQWKGTQDVISQVSSEFENLANVQALVADGFKISAEAAAELANMYPQLLENAQTTADGQILLDEGVYNSFLASRQGMLTTDIDTQIAILEGQKAGLEAAKAKAEAELELVNAVASGTIDIENAKDTLLADASQTLTQYLMDLGVSEVDAQKAAAEAMAGNMEEYNNLVGDVSDDVANNLAGAMSAAAVSSKDNIQDMVTNLDALGRQAASVAEQIANTSEGVTSYSGPVVVGGGGTSGTDFRSTISSTAFTGVDQAQADAFAAGLTEWHDQLKLDISGYTEAIRQIDAQIAVLESLKTRSVKADFGTTDASGGGGSSDKDVEEYLAEIDQFREAAEALAAIQKEIAATELAIDNAETSEQKLALLEKKIDLYKQERDALHNLNEARRAVIKSNVEELKGYGFDVSYNADDNELIINNMEHINELTGEDTEATNELRKAVEDLISSTEDLNDANEEGSKSWLKNYYEEKELLKEKLDTTLDMYREQIDNQQYYAEASIATIENTLISMINAIKTAANEGAITAAEAFDLINEVSTDALSQIKDAIDLQIKVGEAKGILTLEQEVSLWQNYINNLQQAFDQGTISYEKYINGVINAYEEIKSLKEQIIQEQIDRQDAVARAVASVIDEKIKDLKDQKEALEDIANLDSMILELRTELASADKDDAKIIQEKIDYLTEQKAIYNSLTDAEQKRIKMEEIEATLADYTLAQLKKKIEIAKNNLVQRVWYEDRGWVWEADEQAISDAEQALIDYQNQMNSDAIDKQIEALEAYKEQWTSVADVYEDEQDRLIAAQELGANWESEILAQRLDTLQSFVSNYNSLLASLNAIQSMTVSSVANISSSSSGGGSSSSDESLGYEPDFDYQARINEVVNSSANYDANGNFVQGAEEYLAGLEDARNQKIADMGLEDKYPQTTIYTSNTYATGGVNDETAFAALHGTKQKSEVIFNAEDAKKLYDVVHNTDNLTDSIGDSIAAYVPDLVSSIAEISGFTPRTMNLGATQVPTTVSKTEDNSTKFEGCTFEVTSDADSFDALVKDIEIKTKNR